MEALFLGFLVLSVWHFVVQSIIIPNNSHDHKYELFEKRDNLRMLFIEKRINQSEFQILDTYYSNLIFRFKQVTAVDVFFKTIKSIKYRDERKQEIFEEKMRVLNSCKNEEYIDIKKFAFKSSIKISLMNSLGWLPYLSILILLPLILVKLFNVTLFGPFIKKMKMASSQVAIAEENNIASAFC